MTKIPFREHHLLTLLHGYEQQTLPLDLYINHYFRDHKSLGSKDRGFIAENVYAMVRWQGLLDYLAKKPLSWENRHKTYINLDWNEIQNNQEIPLHIRVSFPISLFQLIEKAYGEKRAVELCLISNSPAPTFVRANALKTTRDALLEQWKEAYEVSATSQSPYGIIFHKKINFFGLPEFKAGMFEVQDEGSQLLAMMIQAKPGDHVLDYCSGSGGKTLAFAPQMEQKGQIYLHDIRRFALQEARKRLKRAGIQNAQIILPDSLQLNKIKKKMDWVLVDAPCTGTGTLRRSPDMKWKFDEDTLVRLTGQQRMIFERALSFMKPDGRIVYGTCSILNEENQQQIDHFIRTYGLAVEGKIFQSWPSFGGMDGFFGVVLKRA